VARHFNTMLSEVEKTNRKYRETSTKLMLYARDMEASQKTKIAGALLRQKLNRHVSPDVAAQFVMTDGMPDQDKRQAVTFLLARIKSFTALAERMSPEDVIAMLNSFFDASTNIIFEYDGALDKCSGNELKASFGLIGPADQASHDAVRAATAIQNKVQELVRENKQAGMPDYKVSIGISTGNALAGNIGPKNQMDYTVIGSTVDIAASLAKAAEGGATIMDEETRKRCGQEVQVEEKGQIRIKSRTMPVRCYQVSG
jgi:class 3 adenylate cyclase